MKVDIEVASEIQGWMTFKELEWLAKQAQKYTKIVEIGSYLGRSTRAIGDNTQGFVLTVDDFKGPRDAGMPDILREGIYEIFLYNVGSLVQDGKVIPRVADHTKVDIDFTPDMVFIDGSHEYEDVKRDIELWLPRLAAGGLLCGHDIQFKDVRLAVADTIKDYKVAENTTIWYMTK